MLKFTPSFSQPPAVVPDQFAPANGDDGVAVGADGAEGNGDDPYQAPAALDQMEDVLIEEVGFIDDADDEEDEDDFIDEEVTPNAWSIWITSLSDGIFRVIFVVAAAADFPRQMHVRVEPYAG